jgi:hypothetical protein
MKLPKHIRQQRDSINKQQRNKIYEKKLSINTTKLISCQERLKELKCRTKKNKTVYDKLTANIYYLEHSCANFQTRIEKNLQYIF